MRRCNERRRRMYSLHPSAAANEFVNLADKNCFNTTHYHAVSVIDTVQCIMIS